MKTIKKNSKYNMLKIKLFIKLKQISKSQSCLTPAKGEADFRSAKIYLFHLILNFIFLISKMY